ncbi:glycosyltransferase, partial [bacterium]|nr:glycosyltransferase [bacterium]
MKLDACIISFGPIKSKCNGYDVRVYNILTEASRFYRKVVVLEFPDEDFTETNGLRNVTFIKLHGNELVSHKLTNFFKKIITFDPFQNLKFQITSFVQLWKCRKYIASSDIVIIEGSLIPAGNILAKLLGKKVLLDTHGLNKSLASHFRKRKIMVYFLRALLWDLLERVTMKLSDVVVTVSKKERDFVITEYHIPQHRVSIVPNIIEVEKPAKRDGSAEALRKK